MWAVFAHSPSWPAACRYRGCHSHSGWRAGSWWSWRCLAPLWDSLCHLQHLVLVTLLNLGNAQRPPCWPSLCPPDQLTTFQPNGEAVLCSLGTQLEYSASQHSYLDLESRFQRSGLIPYVLIMQRLCIQGEIFESLSIFPISVCSSVFVPPRLSRMPTEAFMRLRCILYLHNYSQVFSEFLILRFWAQVILRFKLPKALTYFSPCSSY